MEASGSALLDAADAADPVETPAGVAPGNASAMLMFPPGMPLPDGWQAPWLRAGWAVRSCRSAASIPLALASTDASALVAAPWPESTTANSAASISSGLQQVIDTLGVDAARQTAPTIADGGMLRRGTFLTRLANIVGGPHGHGFVLLAVHVDQAAELAHRLERSALFDLEERVCARVASVLDAHDATTIWLEFGFGVLVRRERAESVTTLAEQICSIVATTPFAIGDATFQLTVSVGMALAPGAPGADGAQQWFAAAYAAQGIARRHGGNRSEGLLTRAYEPMPPERVLIVREWVNEAKSGSNVIIEFQPLIALAESAAALYSVHVKLRDQRAPLGGVDRSEYLRLAREAGAMAMIDRLSVFSAFAELEKERAGGRATQLLLRLDYTSLDGAAWRWLEAELRRRAALADGMIIEIESSAVRDDAHARVRLTRLRALGVRVCLNDVSGSLYHLRSWCELPIDMLLVAHAVVRAKSPDALRTSLQRWRALGRAVIVDAVDNAAAVARMAECGIGYIRSDALAACGLRLDYETDHPR